jgi:hypothetical protein
MLNVTTETDIALLSRLQIESQSKSELIRYAKILGLKKYSKKNQKPLADDIYEASNPKRQAFINADNVYNQSLEDKEKSKEDGFKSSDYISKAKIFNSLKKLNPVQFAEYLYNIFDNAVNRGELVPSSIATNIKTTLFKTLDEMLEDSTYHLTKETVLEIKEAIKEHNKPYNFAKKDLERQKINQYAVKAEKTLDANPIIKWALDALESTRHEHQSLALSILSGRRMVEIYGDNTSYSLGENGLITIKGIAKKKDDSNDNCDFIPLCDSKKWLTVWENLECKGKTAKQVNETNARMISRNYPKELKEMGIEKFKDSRDFYAGLCITSFSELDYAMPEHFTMMLMGHESGESTKYYRKYEVTNIPENIIEKFKNYQLK